MNEFIAAALLGAILRELYFFNKHQEDYLEKSYWKDRFDDILFGVGSALVFGFWGGDIFKFLADLGISKEWEWLFILGDSWHPIWALVLGLMSSALIGWVIESGFESIKNYLSNKVSKK